MSAFGGFGTFGSNNNQQQSSTPFSGFGSNNTTGFGQQTTNTGFGGGTGSTGGGLFGSGGSAFGASSSTPFGSANKSAFGGGTTGASLFGGTTTTAGGTSFGGFGSNANNTTSGTTSAFGSGGGLFGNASKPGFGTGTTTGGSLFGANTGGNTFGQSGTTGSAFGAPASTALGMNTAECQGTGSTPFQAFNEKDGPSSNTMNHFQSISFMAPYQKFSFEELRLADYNQGRRYGNGSGQAGAFGASTGFGGFGQTNTQNTGSGFGTGSGGSLFGAQPTTSASPFGGATQTTGAFSGTGLFGASKPATGGLFGSTPATSAQSGSSLFGTAGTGGFGSTQGAGFGTNTGGSGSLFGATQQAQKPGFSFGATNTATPASGTGFGSTGGFGVGTNNSGGGGLFGGANSQSASLFGGQQQQQPASNPFGQAAQPQSGFGGFGNSAAKPGLFGTSNTTTTGGGLFGNANQNPNQSTTAANPFGTTPNASSGGLFGAKPAATGAGGLFGNVGTSNPGGGLFGNTTSQPQQNQTGGLFGNNSQQQQKPAFGNFGGGSGGLFGNTNTNTTNLNAPQGSLFGAQPNNQNQQSSGSFGSNSNASSLFGSLQQNSLQPPMSMTASIMDRNPYGSSSIFTGLPPPPQTSPGPIATPILAGQKPKKLAPLPQYKINPSMASRLVTPQKRGFGFSYSTYGTPSSISSNPSTPAGLGNSLLGSSIGRGLGKSFSTSNLRRTFDTDGDSILSPGAFSTGSNRYAGVGSMKRLTIDRSLRTDLFGAQPVAALPSPDKNDQSRQSSNLKKKVSFDATALGGNGNANDANGTTNGTTSSDETATPSAEEQGLLRSASRTSTRPNGARSNPATEQPEMEQVKGNELAIVHEDETSEEPNGPSSQGRQVASQVDPQPGQYYMRPSREELRKMPRDKLKKMSGFTLGRENCGHVVFDQPVDLTSVDLDNIFGNIAVITLRSLTVYPQTDKKPPLGKGLNVPSTITLENSWPRQRDRKTPSYEKSGPRFLKHVDRLKKVNGTEFVKYNKDTGEWVFRVPHFTTYALDFDDTGSEGDTLQTNVLSDAPDTPTPKSRTPKMRYTPMPHAQESSVLSEDLSHVSSGPDDTFDFKKKKVLPGAFDDATHFGNDQEMEEALQNGESFLGDRSATSPSENGLEEPSDLFDNDDEVEDSSLVIQDVEMDMAGAFPETEIEVETHPPTSNVFQPKSILKESQRKGAMVLGTPGKLAADLGDPWAEQLQQTISPRKQDRQTLRESQAHLFQDLESVKDLTPRPTGESRDGKGFATSIDLMNSLFGKEEARKSGRGTKRASAKKGFEWPYPKKSKTSEDEREMDDMERRYHESFKPRWGADNTILYAMPTQHGVLVNNAPTASILNDTRGTIVSGGRDIRVRNFVKSAELTRETFARHRELSEISTEHGIPIAKAQSLPFDAIFIPDSSELNYEQLVWELASILFDDGYDDEHTDGLSEGLRENFHKRILKDRLSDFWAHICEVKARKAVDDAPTAEERAIALLSMHNIPEACNALVEGKDFRLATLVAQIGGDPIVHQDMTTQINEWRNLNVLSEMSESVRAIYGLLAGSTCVCEGKRGPLEDQASTFALSERFKLDWKRAYGLRLWYAILTDDTIEDAVHKYAADLGNDETAYPVPWFIEDKKPLPWDDQHVNEREDLLWGILKFFAEPDNRASLADMVMPQNATGNPVDVRFSFELYQSFAARFPTEAEPDRADQLTVDFATQLESAGQWTWALFVLLHLSDRVQRQKALQTILAHHAAAIDESDAQLLRMLLHDFQIPETWIWEAKALYARSVQKDQKREVEYLLRAKNWTEAHKTLCRLVAPQAIIEEDYTMLQHLTDNFSGKDKVKDWPIGGQVYEDYARLMKGVKGRERGPVVKRLLSALPSMVEDRSGKLEFVEMVAVQEMSAVVGRVVLEDRESTFDAGRVLQLPLTKDIHLKHTMNLSLNYYQALMAGGK